MSNVTADNKNFGKKMFYSGLGAAMIFGWIFFPYIVYKPMDQPLQFSHAAHNSDDVGLKCEDCHAFDTDGRFCGIPSIEKCAACHSEPMGISNEEKKLSEDYVKPGREIPWIIYSKQPQNVFFSHATHVKLAGIECRSCHFGQANTRKLRPAYISRISGYSLDVFGKDLFNLPSTPSLGMRMDDCSSCHHERGVKESCIDCHK